MVTYNYTSKTDFNQELSLDIVEIVGDRKTETRYYGFRTLQEAQEFAEWWSDRWYFGYMGSAAAFTDADGRFIVDASRYNSCD
jgi:hypothetical protein